MTALTTLHLQGCLDRLRAGDAAACNDLLRHAEQRLRDLAHKMLGNYRRLRRWEETDDVLQGALLRLCRAVTDLKPETVRSFHRLAALQIRRELIDLVRHYFGPQGLAAHHASQGDAAPDAPPPDRGDDTCDPARLSVWTEFHQQVEALPESEREVFDLLWYQGLTQAEAAALLGVDVRTVKRRWLDARVQLHQAMHGESPV